jgi:hypothetical protein
MKKITLSFFAILMLISFSLKAQVAYKINENTYQKIGISFIFGDLKTTDILTTEGKFSQIYMDGCGNGGDFGKPELPVSVSMLEVPIFGDYVLNVYGKDFVIYDASELGINYPVYPAQPPVSKSHQGPVEFLQNKNTYQTDDFYALPLAQFEEVGIMRNVNLGQLYVSPVQYNPVTHKIKIYKSIDVEIQFKKVEFVKTQIFKELHKSPLFYPSHIINPVKSERAEFSNTPVKYLIVAHEMFKGALDEFMAWKKRKGFIVEIGYTDDPNVGTSTTSIKNFITSHYTNATPENPAPTYVLLVGDVQQIPAFMMTSLDYGDPDHPTDLYYFTWNGGNLPCCYYGRFSAQNLTHLTPQIVKTLQYEQFTMPDPDYLNNICLIAGYDVGAAPTYGNGFVYYVTQNYATTEYGYTNVYAHFHPCSGKAVQIRAEISAGVGIANYTAHCDENGWSNPSFSKSHISTMNNLNKYGLLIGSCCYSSKFDYNECFAEAMLRATGKGAVGYIGGSDYTYWGPDYYWSIGVQTITSTPSYTTNLGAYDRLFHTHGEIYENWMATFGSMIKAGNEAVQMASSSYNDYKKYYWQIYNLMGDPSLMTYLTQPSQMEVELPNELIVDETTLTAKVAPYSYCALTGNEGELISAGFADAEGNITLSFDPAEVGEYEFAAWAQKYIQYYKTIPCIAQEGSFNTGSIELTPANIPINGAQIFFDVALKNIGLDDSAEIELTLKTESNDVIIINDTIYVSTLESGEEMIVSEIFSTSINEYVEDETPVTFTLNVVSNYNTFQQDIEIVIIAPKLEITGSNVSNASGEEFIFPGDEVEIVFEVSNIGHNDIFNVGSSFTSINFEFLGFPQPQIFEINAGESEKVSIKGIVDTHIEEETIIEIFFWAFQGSYEAEGTAEVFVSKPNAILYNKMTFCSIYPNPATEELRITNYELRIENVEIYDIYGRNVGTNLHVCSDTDGVVINVSHLPAGIYFIKIIDESQQIVIEKFVKQ